MKTLSEAKQKLTVGTKVKVINYYKSKTEVTNRLVTKANSNTFSTALEITEENEKKYINVQCNWQKASQMNIKDNQIDFLAYEYKDYMGNKKVFPNSMFKKGQPWLTIIVEDN